MEKAFAVQQKHYWTYSSEVAKTLTNLGNVYFYLGDPKKQIFYWKKHRPYKRNALDKLLHCPL